MNVFDSLGTGPLLRHVVWGLVCFGRGAFRHSKKCLTTWISEEVQSGKKIIPWKNGTSFSQLRWLSHTVIHAINIAHANAPLPYSGLNHSRGGCISASSTTKSESRTESKRARPRRPRQIRILGRREERSGPPPTSSALCRPARPAGSILGAWYGTLPNTRPVHKFVYEDLRLYERKTGVCLASESPAVTSHSRAGGIVLERRHVLEDKRNGCIACHYYEPLDIQSVMQFHVLGRLLSPPFPTMRLPNLDRLRLIWLLRTPSTASS